MMANPEEILAFKLTNFNKVAAVAGGFLSVFGLVSYLLKEKFYLGEAIVSTIAGVIFSPHATDLIRPLEYARGNPKDLESITLYFTRMVLGVQLVIAGIQLPSKYLKHEWKSLAFLLGPGMCAMWISTSLIVWALVPDIPFLYALAVGSCVTPTDPILSNSIVKGKFADKNIPKKLQRIIIAESGANDGLGYPFLFIALYLLRYTHDGGLGQDGGAAKAMGYWFGITWGYEIILSVLYGALVGWVFKVALQWAEERKYVDRESFLVFAVSIALFIVGTLGMIGSDDVLACFIAGNAFTWDDWFRIETHDDSFQPTIDMLLNVAIFVWYGAVCPWHSFVSNNVIPIYRLIFIGVLVLLFRRVPVVIAMRSQIHQIDGWRQTGFVGFFGPIGVSAIFYLYTSREYLAGIRYKHHQRADAERLAEVFDVVVWFMVICSIVVHGLSIPLGKLGLWLPKTVSRALSSEGSLASRERDRGANNSQILPFRIQGPLSKGKSAARPANNSTAEPPGVRPSVFRIGGTVIKDPEAQTDESSPPTARPTWQPDDRRPSVANSERQEHLIQTRSRNGTLHIDLPRAEEEDDDEEGVASGVRRRRDDDYNEDDDDYDADRPLPPAPGRRHRGILPATPPERRRIRFGNSPERERGAGGGTE